jgi:glycerol-3-phosphate dehydrogenase (NAD(P)+)
VNKIAILGAGAFGFAIAKILSENSADKEFYIFDVQREHIEHIRKTKRHPLFHGDTELPGHVLVTHSIEEAVSEADIIVLAMPSRHIRFSISSFKHLISKRVIFLSIIKGLEYGTNMRPSEVVADELKNSDIEYDYCILSGGMIAREVTLGHPLGADIACDKKEVAKAVARLFWNDHLRIETTTDVIGVELAGAFKNVIAIGAGILDGLGYAESSKSAFITTASKEIVPLAISLGADEKTYSSFGYAWFSDLMTTCFGKSRNRQFGELIGKGMSVEEAVEEMQSSNLYVEGYVTAKVVNNLLKERGIDAPILTSIYNILYQKQSRHEFLAGFIKGE